MFGFFEVAMFAADLLLAFLGLKSPLEQENDDDDNDDKGKELTRSQSQFSHLTVTPRCDYNKTGRRSYRRQTALAATERSIKSTRAIAVMTGPT